MYTSNLGSEKKETLSEIFQGLVLRKAHLKSEVCFQIFVVRAPCSLYLNGLKICSLKVDQVSGDTSSPFLRKYFVWCRHTAQCILNACKLHQWQTQLLSIRNIQILLPKYQYMVAEQFKSKHSSPFNVLKYVFCKSLKKSQYWSGIFSK